MHNNDIARFLRKLRANYQVMNQRERLEIARTLCETATYFVKQLRADLHESEATANRRNAKRRETEGDPKPPLSPVCVAEPSKPKKPKYSGNHAPPARRR